MWHLKFDSTQKASMTLGFHQGTFVLRIIGITNAIRLEEALQLLLHRLCLHTAIRTTTAHHLYRSTRSLRIRFAIFINFGKIGQHDGSRRSSIPKRDCVVPSRVVHDPKVPYKRSGWEGIDLFGGHDVWYWQNSSTRVNTQTGLRMSKGRGEQKGLRIMGVQGRSDEDRVCDEIGRAIGRTDGLLRGKNSM